MLVRCVIESMCTNGYEKNFFFPISLSVDKITIILFLVSALNMYMHVHPVIFIDAFYIISEKKKQ